MRAQGRGNDAIEEGDCILGGSRNFEILLDPKKGVNKHFENVLYVKGVFRIFLQVVERHHILTFFPVKLLWSKSRDKNASSGVRGYAASEIFWKFT